MAYELVYTSAPEGLNRGSSGFCVVACTKGLGPRLVVTLEGLSAYKPLYPHYAPNAWDNPVSRSHYIYEANGERQHILSRICFNGVDHTGRSNKLASHLVLSEREAAIAQGGPSSLLLREELFKDAAWPIKAEYFTKQKEIPPTTVQVRKCALWGSVMGDPGWAGFLAQTYLDTPNKNVYLAYDPAQHKDILPLLDEAMALLPDELRWKVTFNTYFVNLPAGMSCTWRCCPVDSDALRAARRSPMNMVIDITKPQTLDRESALITCARTGILAKPEKSMNTPAETVARAVGRDEEDGIEQPVYLDAPEVKNASPEVSEQYFVPNYPRENENGHSAVAAWARLILTLLAIIALLAAIIGGALYFVSVTKEKQARAEEFKTLQSSYADAEEKVKQLKQTASEAKEKKIIAEAETEIADCMKRLDAIIKKAKDLTPHQKFIEGIKERGKKEKKTQEESDFEPVEEMKGSTPDGIISGCKKMKTELGKAKETLEEKRKEIDRRKAEENAEAQRSKTPSVSFDPGRTLPPQPPAEKKQNKNSGKVKKLDAADPRYLWLKSVRSLRQGRPVDVQLGVRDPDKVAILLMPSMKKQQIGSTFRCEPDPNDRQAEIETKFDRAKGILSFTLKNQFSPSPQTEILIRLGNGKVLPLYFKLGISRIKPKPHPGNVKIEIDKNIKVSIAQKTMQLPDSFYAEDNSLCSSDQVTLCLNCNGPKHKKLKLEKQGEAYIFEDGDSVLKSLRSRLEALRHIEEEIKGDPMGFAQMAPDKLKNECEKYAKLSRGKQDDKKKAVLKNLADKMIVKLKTKIPLSELGKDGYTGTWEKEKADAEKQLAARKREIGNAIRNSTVALHHKNREYEQFPLKDILQ